MQVRYRLTAENIVGGDMDTNLSEELLELESACNVTAIINEGLVELDLVLRCVENLGDGDEDSLMDGGTRGDGSLATMSHGGQLKRRNMLVKWFC